MKILYADDQCGAGKTRWALRHMAENPGRYVYVIDRREMAETRRDGIKAFADGRSIVMTTIFSGDDAEHQSVGRRIADAGDDFRLHHHVVLIITHAGMQRVDSWKNFKGWEAIIVDEIPSILDHDVHATSPFEKAGLEKFYELVPSTAAGESKITFRGGYNSNDLKRSGSPMLKFHQRVVDGEARCDLTSWDDLDEREQWCSWTLWDAAKLDVFRRVYIIGDSFTETVTYHLMVRQGSFEFVPMLVATPRRWADRPVTIRYASDAQRAGTTKLKAEPNAAQLVKLGKWLGGVGTQDHIWTCNNDDSIGRKLTASGVPGRWLPPKQAGSNDWAAFHAASAIYAAKPAPQERRFFHHLGISADVITASRETYDLRQFFMRTSLRDPTSTAPVELRTLDRWQAEAFAAYLTEKYGLSPEIVFDDIGLEFAAKKVGRPPGKAMSAEQRSEANRLAQERWRERKREKKAA